MESRVVCCIILVVFVMVAGFAESDLDKDKAECANQLVGLATCLPYVSGEAKAPTVDCCTGLRQVVQKSKICLCILVKDRNDPGLGLKINATLALSLPTTCHAPANVSECPSLLHLAPNSPESKVFDDFTKSASNTTATTAGKGIPTGNEPSAGVKSEGGKGQRWLGVEAISVAITWMAVHAFFCGLSLI